MSLQVEQEQLPEQYSLRPYQETACNDIVRIMGGRAILGDEVGLGKTGIAIEAWKRLSNRHLGLPEVSDSEDQGGKRQPLGPALLVAGNNAFYTWWRLSPCWGVSRPVRISGSAFRRQGQWAKVQRDPTAFVSCTRETLIRDFRQGWVPSKWVMIFNDEAHKTNNKKTQIYAVLKKLGNPTLGANKWFIHLTGSPIKRGPQNLWALLNILEPKRYASYWRFVGENCHIVKGTFGWEILGPKNIHQLQKDLANILICRKKVDVRPDMPPLQRVQETVEPTEEQRRIQRELVEQALTELNESQQGTGEYVIAPLMLTKIMRLRQLSVSPRLLSTNPGDAALQYGASLDHIVDMLEQADDTHMVIFTPFTKAFTPCIQRLSEAGIDLRTIVTISGGMDNSALDTALRTFRDTRGIALCSIKFAESFDLTPASWAVMLGFEWDAEENKQAEGRLHRGLEIDYPVMIHYLINRATIDEDVWWANDIKSRYAYRSLNNVESTRQMLTNQLRTLTSPT